MSADMNRAPSLWDCADRGHVPVSEGGGCLACGEVPTCPHGYDGPHAVYHDVLVGGCHRFESAYLMDCPGPLIASSSDASQPTASPTYATETVGNSDPDESQAGF